MLKAIAILALFAQQTPLEVLQVRPNIYMIAGPGGNTTVQIGSDGVIVIDPGSLEKSDAVLAEIRKLTDQPIRFVINTGPDSDHVAGNEKLAKAGRTILNGATAAANACL